MEKFLETLTLDSVKAEVNLPSYFLLVLYENCGEGEKSKASLCESPCITDVNQNIALWVICLA